MTALVTEANSVTPPSAVRRRERFRLRRAAAAALPKERVAKCGHHDHGGGVSIRRGEHAAHLSGLQTCGSVWACPVCAAKIAETRRAEVEATIRAHTQAGGTVYMAAFTIPHHMGQRAKPLRDAVADVWRRVQAGAPWKRAGAKAGLLGLVRALEVTHGSNGWHPHLHVLFFLDGKADQDAVDAFGRYAFERWAKFVEKTGLGVCNPDVYRFEPAQCTERAGEYVTKWGADSELTKAQYKQSRAGGRSPWAILYDLAEYGRARDKMLFREYAHAFRGARQLTWSRGLRERYGLREPAPDTEAAAYDAEETAPVIATLPRATYRALYKRGLVCRLLEAVEAAPTLATVRAFLAAHGLDGAQPPPSSEASPFARACGVSPLRTEAPCSQTA